MVITNFVDEANFLTLGFKTKQYLKLCWVGKGFKEVTDEEGVVQYYKVKRNF